eukprot:3169099-Pyramimonas_sp.AAC.1
MIYIPERGTDRSGGGRVYSPFRNENELCGACVCAVFVVQHVWCSQRRATYELEAPRNDLRGGRPVMSISA